LGPEGGERGGNIVAEGTPEAIAMCAASHTGRYLDEVLKGAVAPKEPASRPRVSESAKPSKRSASKR